MVKDNQLTAEPQDVPTQEEERPLHVALRRLSASYAPSGRTWRNLLFDQRQFFIARLLQFV
ncbi:MAG: hypothetical protein OQL21_01885, partial [Gammaproteobacteria bacterium]|nr:hypothetical protein [Gammaproteobacteria bacterium]